MGDVTHNFSWHEFNCKCCGFNNIDIRAIHRLQVVRDIVEVPVIILSGCRCETHNKEVGGAPESYHRQGLAIDWTVENEEKLCLVALTLRRWSGGFHYYAERKFIHTDIGPVRRW